MNSKIKLIGAIAAIAVIVGAGYYAQSGDLLKGALFSVGKVKRITTETLATKPAENLQNNQNYAIINRENFTKTNQNSVQATTQESFSRPQENSVSATTQESTSKPQENIAAQNTNNYAEQENTLAKTEPYYNKPIDFPTTLELGTVEYRTLSNKLDDVIFSLFTDKPLPSNSKLKLTFNGTEIISNYLSSDCNGLTDSETNKFCATESNPTSLNFYMHSKDLPLLTGFKGFNTNNNMQSPSVSVTVCNESESLCVSSQATTTYQTQISL